MQENLASLKKAAWHAQYAHEYTQRLYDNNPPNGQLVPQILPAIEVWPFVYGCYMGIEQTLKVLIRLRKKNSENKFGHTHDLGHLYGLLDSSEQEVVANYYRVYRSLYNFDAGDISIDTADEFIQHISKGYAAWRYILVEDHPDIPKIHLGLMFEIWRALAELASASQPKPLNQRMEIYFRTEVFDKAEQSEIWESAALDDSSEVELGDIRRWVREQGEELKAGIRLFRYHAKHTLDPRTASSVLHRVLLSAASNAVDQFRLPIEQPEERRFWSRQDIAALYEAIHRGGLSWDETNEVFTHG